MKTLVIYFSRSGVTQTVAEQVARGCKADIEPVKDLATRSGLAGYVRSVAQAARHAEPTIGKGAHSPRDYDLVVLGTPIWCWNMSSPMRSYIRRHQGQFRKVALFCTYGGSGHEGVLADMQKLCGVSPVATLALTTAQVQEGRSKQAISEFVKKIQGVERAAKA